MAATIDTDLLRTFLAIAETGSFTRAAEEVNKTQSAVSMQMKKLEERLDRTLFLRGGRSVRLTPDGQRLMDYAQRIVRLNEEAVAAFTMPELAGLVTLGVPDDYAHQLLPRVLSAFNRTHPHVELVVHCYWSGMLTELVGKGELDMAIVTHGVYSALGEMVRREPLYWVASPEHCVHLSDPVPIAVGLPVCPWRLAAMRSLDSINRPYRIAYTSSAAVALASAVTAGLAVAVLPESAIRPEMRVLTEAEGFPPLPACEIGFVRGKHAVSAIHDALARHIVARIGNLPPRSLTAAE